jgi:glycosyltransferase involved in cell wall biosynthesis
MVSVIVVNYNGEKLIRQSLQSLINKSFQNLEIIVVDNSSKDLCVINPKRIPDGESN